MRNPISQDELEVYLKKRYQPFNIELIIGDGINVISTGVAGDRKIDFPCRIMAWTILPDVSGSIVVDIWKDTYANFPPTNADAMPGSGKEPTLSSAAKAEDADLTDWVTTDIAAGDTLRYNVDSATTVKRVTLTLKAYKL